MKKLTQEHELEGKTIRGAFNEHQGNGLVLVFEDDDWCLLTIADEMSADESVAISQCSFSQYDADIKNFLSPEDLLKALLLTQAQYDYLIDQNTKAKAAKLRADAEAFISAAKQLEESA